ncbi:Hypothetical predicted protein [Paramuricea clavata]|uniref:Uncharacterized protein n=1 Tax=Paramuricea clavata TaxID=317549 RepID=A0A7D9JTE5_PARCT|nr:Hypothetical predicted protein [Paramuricea clavata]
MPAGDASALEKYYHRKCLWNAQRTFKPIEMCSVNQLIHSACEEQLLLSVQNSLTDDDAILSMAEVNSTYVSILNRYRVQISETANYRKHLKKLLSECLPSVQFVKSLRENEPDRIVLPRAVSKGIELRCSLMDNSETIGRLKNIDILRKPRNWSFNGSFEEFQNPPLLQFFLSHLLFGHHVLKASGIRSEEVDRTVDVACQFLIQNSRSDRQVETGGFCLPDFVKKGVNMVRSR